MLVEARLFAFRQLFFLVFNRLSIFVILNHLLEESVLCILVASREAVKDVTPVATVIFAELELKDLPKKFIRDTDLVISDDDLGPAVFGLFHVGTLFIDGFLHGSLDLFQLGAAIVDQLVLSGSLLIDGSHAENLVDHLSYVHTRDVVILCQLLRIERLARSRWASHEDLDWVKTAESVELGLEGADALPDSELGVPGELLFLLKFFLLLWFELKLFLSERYCLEAVGRLHAQIDCQLLLPAAFRVGLAVCFH